MTLTPGMGVTPPTQRPPLPDEDLIQAAVKFVDMMMNCASSDTLGVTQFWPRAQSALVTGASAERRWSGIVSRTAAKLQVPILLAKSNTCRSGHP